MSTVKLKINKTNEQNYHKDRVFIIILKDKKRESKYMMIDIT